LISNWFELSLANISSCYAPEPDDGTAIFAAAAAAFFSLFYFVSA